MGDDKGQEHWPRHLKQPPAVAPSPANRTLVWPCWTATWEISRLSLHNHYHPHHHHHSSSATDTPPPVRFCSFGAGEGSLWNFPPSASPGLPKLCTTFIHPMNLRLPPDLLDVSDPTSCSLIDLPLYDHPENLSCILAIALATIPLPRPQFPSEHTRGTRAHRCTEELYHCGKLVGHTLEKLVGEVLGARHESCRVL